MYFNLDLCCLIQLFNLQVMCDFKAFMQKKFESYTRDIKSIAVVRQKLYTVSTRSVILGWGRMNPLRRMRWPVQVQTCSRDQMYFTEVLLGGKAQVRRALYTSSTP